MKVDVTQFLRPNGRQVPQTTEVSDDCAAGYEAMRKCGCRLTAEELMTGHISCTIEQPDEGDVDIKISPNGPDVQKGIEKMLREFTPEKFEEWRQTMNGEEAA